MQIIDSNATIKLAVARAAVAVAGMCVGMSLVYASALQVSPVRLQFEGAQRAQAIQVLNQGGDNLNAQVRVMRWTQENGVDKLEPAEDVVASPAIVQVASGKQQMVRVIRIHSAPPAQELSYRVLVDELPGKAATERAVGLKVLLRYSIPVFVTPKTSSPAPAVTDLTKVQAQLLPGSNGQSVLQVKNSGPSYVRISNLRTVRSNGVQKSLGGAGLFGYVLAGQQMSWPVDVAYPLSSDLSLEARFNDDRQSQTLPLDRSGR